MNITPNSIWNMDCIQGMQNIKKKSVDLIVTDPPFGIDFKAAKANYNRKADLVLDGYHEVAYGNYSQFTYLWLEQAKEILKDGGAMYIFSGDQNLRHILNALDDFNFAFQQIIWNYQFATYARISWVIAHYNIIYAWKKKHKPQLNTNCRFSNTKDQYHDMQSVWNIKREYWTGEQKTPTKLPYEIVAKILSYSSKKKDTVCDPFLGSGQVAVVSKDMGRKYIGFEISKNYYEFAKQQLAPKVITA